MTMRSIDTRFWSDGWIRQLNALDRYLFLYLLTNDKTNWCGVYELDLGMMAFECGLDERDLEKSLLPRLSPKVIYVDGWVYIPNFPKYHLNGTDSTQKGYEKAFSQIPERIRLKIRGIESEGVVPPTHPSSAFAFASASSKEADELEDEFSAPSSEEDTTDIHLESVDEDGAPLKYNGFTTTPRRAGQVSKNKQALAIQALFIEKAKQILGVAPIRDTKGYYRVLEAMKVLTGEQIIMLITDWFDAKGKEEDKMSLAACLSTNSINRFKVREGIV